MSESNSGSLQSGNSNKSTLSMSSDDCEVACEDQDDPQSCEAVLLAVCRKRKLRAGSTVCVMNAFKRALDAPDNQRPDEKNYILVKEVAAQLRRVLDQLQFEKTSVLNKAFLMAQARLLAREFSEAIQPNAKLEPADDDTQNFENDDTKYIRIPAQNLVKQAADDLKLKQTSILSGEEDELPLALSEVDWVAKAFVPGAPSESANCLQGHDVQPDPTKHVHLEVALKSEDETQVDDMLNLMSGKFRRRSRSRSKPKTKKEDKRKSRDEEPVRRVSPPANSIRAPMLSVTTTSSTSTDSEDNQQQDRDQQLQYDKVTEFNCPDGKFVWFIRANANTFTKGTAIHTTFTKQELEDLPLHPNVTFNVAGDNNFHNQNSSNNKTDTNQDNNHNTTLNINLNPTTTTVPVTPTMVPHTVNRSQTIKMDKCTSAVLELQASKALVEDLLHAPQPQTTMCLKGGRMVQSDMFESPAPMTTTRWRAASPYSCVTRHVQTGAPSLCTLNAHTTHTPLLTVPIRIGPDTKESEQWPAYVQQAIYGYTQTHHKTVTVLNEYDQVVQTPPTSRPLNSPSLAHSNINQSVYASMSVMSCASTVASRAQSSAQHLQRKVQRQRERNERLRQELGLGHPTQPPPATSTPVQSAPSCYQHLHPLSALGDNPHKP